MQDKCCNGEEKDKKIAKLEAQIKEMQAGESKAPNKRRRVRIFGCKNCKAQGKGKTCSHCFVCGDSSHKVEKCPKRNEKEKESNSNRSSGGIN